MIGWDKAMKNNKHDYITRTEFYAETKSIRYDLGSAITKTHSELMEEIVSTRMELKEDIGKVLGVIDAFTLRIETYDRKAIVHDARINDHEARITRLEHPS